MNKRGNPSIYKQILLGRVYDHAVQNTIKLLCILFSFPKLVSIPGGKTNRKTVCYSTAR